MQTVIRYTKNNQAIQETVLINYIMPLSHKWREFLRMISMSQTPTKKMIISVDVEAFHKRQSSNHAEKLIWGKFGQKEAGIGSFMEIADKHGCKLTFFVDYCETFMYPGEFEIITKKIIDQGHDLQLHAHPDLLPDAFWEQRGLKQWNSSLSGYTKERADILFDFLIDSAVGMGAPKPVGFRGGAFRFNHEILAAMEKRGITISFNYHTLASHQPNNAVNLPAFRWDNGIYEIPMSFIEYNGKLLAFDLNGEIDFMDHKKVHTLIDKFYASSSNENVLVMLMHSWSFLHRNKDTGYFEYLNDNLAASFDQFLSKLPSDMRIVTATDLNHELQSHDLKVNITREVDLANRSKYGSADFTPSITLSSPGITHPSPDIKLVENTSDDASCNYCGTPKNLMEDFGGREKARCPKCLSLERQRVFLWAYEQFIKHEYDFANKTILLVTPSDAILNYLKPIANLTTCDVRPVSWFDMQCDISKMPQVKSNSYDTVIAKAVMQHVFDDEAALDEIRRVIKPWGRFFMQTSSKLNSETASFEDISKHYGKDVLEKYNVGTFRYYGDRSILRSLQKRFLVKTFYGIDPVTMRQDVIYCGIKDGKGL